MFVQCSSSNTEKKRLKEFTIQVKGDSNERELQDIPCLRAVCAAYHLQGG
jgi:hypothetical protein